MIGVRCPVKYRSGARRRDKVLDEVSTAIPGDAVAGNELITGLSGAFHGLN
jgi:hypothetical protein